jgi:mRNA-degrading endonuclease toxin of MazEF toxin-antitoxin module
VHALDLRDARGRVVATLATHVVVISDDAWNARMATVVGVPVYPGEAAVSVFHTPVAELGYADASRTQSFAVSAIGTGVCELHRDVRDAVVRSAVAYLDLDELAHSRMRRPVAMSRDMPRARQRDIHWADLGLDERKRVLVLSPDERNARAPYVTALYVTSRDKRSRRAWQVPAAGGWVVTGDILLCAQRALEHRRRPAPRRATASEMAEVATGVRAVLTAM